MDATIRSLCRYWLVYVLLVAVSVASLIATGAKEVSPRQERLVDLSASRTGSLTELMKNNDWMNQVKFFNKGWLGPESADWNDPPASQSVSAEVTAIQQAKAADADKAANEYGFDAASNSSEIATKTLNGKLSFDERTTAQNSMMKPAGRYTTLIITGDGDLRPFVRCIRTDTGKQVGAYSDQFPVMAVAVNNWASIKVHASLNQTNERLQYRILSLSADQVTTKELLLWHVMRDLTTKEAERRVLSLSELDARAAWLESALGVRFSPEEAANAQDPDVKRLLTHLRSLQ